MPIFYYKRHRTFNFHLPPSLLCIALDCSAQSILLPHTTLYSHSWLSSSLSLHLVVAFVISHSVVIAFVLAEVTLVVLLLLLQTLSAFVGIRVGFWIFPISRVLHRFQSSSHWPHHYPSLLSSPSPQICFTSSNFQIRNFDL